VTDAASVRKAMTDAVAELGRLDILVNNAGIAHVGRLDTTSEEDFERVYQVNVRGVYVCCKEAVEIMKAAGGGVIVNLASIASLVGIEDRFAYSMSKGAVLSMTRSIAVDYLTESIRCNCVCPARVHTPFVDRFIADSYPGREREMFEQLSKSQPIGRMGTPDEVAALVLYLSSDEAAFVTGAAYPIDGAFTAV
jgi:NAD(P)-dependent dehydrogenase (short-subunit alcohol dehydrogenase family)